MEQMMERLLSKMDAKQAEMKTTQEVLAKMDANQAEMLVRMEAKIDTDQE
jgi:hypothetical protein